MRTCSTAVVLIVDGFRNPQKKSLQVFPLVIRVLVIIMRSNNNSVNVHHRLLLPIVAFDHHHRIRSLNCPQRARTGDEAATESVDPPLLHPVPSPSTVRALAVDPSRQSHVHDPAELPGE